MSRRFLLLVSLSSLITISQARESICDANRIVQAALQHIDSITDYRVQAHITFAGRQALSEIDGKPPRYLRIEMRLIKPASTVQWTHIYDGEFQWIENRGPGILEIMRIDLSKVTKPSRPFDTGYWLMGSGLLAGEDYPSTLRILLTIYSLTATCANQHLLLVGTVQMNKLRKYMVSRTHSLGGEANADKFAEQFPYIVIELRPDTYFIDSYRLGPTSSNQTFIVDFRELSINQGMKEELLTYRPEKYEQVIDITDDLLMLQMEGSE